MRRPARRLFTLCSAVSLLLCVAVCVLWARSYFVRDVIEYDAPTRWDEVISARGRVAVLLQPGSLAGLAPRGGTLAWSAEGPPGDLRAADVGRPSLDRLGFAVVRSPAGSEASWAYYAAPHWSLALLAALAPARWW